MTARSVRTITTCRSCGGSLAVPFCDLGDQPVANDFVSPARAGEPDARYRLRVMVCAGCRLAQLDTIVDASTIFSDYAYLSSVSTSWLAHARQASLALAERQGLGPSSFVVEVASNDGYMLRNFVAAGIPCLGIEPAANVAQRAEAAGVPTLVRFFGVSTAAEVLALHRPADLVIANNVLAHVPDVNDFVGGLAALLAPAGLLAIESPHLVRLAEGLQFDTIYHEHYAYWSLMAMEGLLRRHGLAVVDLVVLPTHGGSLRVMAMRAEAAPPPSPAVLAVRAEEARLGLDGDAWYAGFGPRIGAVIAALRDHLAAARARGETVAAYGAAAKGNTFLNATGLGPADIVAVADANPLKIGTLLPGSRIPVVSPDALAALRPDAVLVLPWNIAEEIGGVLAGLGLAGRQLITAIPRLSVRDIGA